MAGSSDIRIDKSDSHFALTGDIRAVLENRRLMFSLKRLQFEIKEDGILIPFDPQKEISTLQEIQELLGKFGFSNEMSLDVKNDNENFIREQDTFKGFSEKARDIRNDKFKDEPGLVQEFDSFQQVIAKRLVRRLYPLQLLSAFHMAFAQNACNFSVPGAGKTSIVYAAYAYLKNLPEDNPRRVDKLLVIGPLSSFSPWEEEYKECFGTDPDAKRLSGDDKMLRSHKEEHLFSGNPAEITLIFHGGVERMQNEIVSFLKRNKTMVIVDEAHRIKNPEGVWGKSIVAISKEAKARVVLTGTPVPNGYEDLFNLFQYLYPYKYKDILRFHYGNLVDLSKNGDTDGSRVKELINNISPYFIRIKKNDLHLPPVREETVTVPMDERQREIYDFIESRYVKSFKNDSSANVKDVLNKAKLIRLRQAATNPALLQKPLRETLFFDDFEERVSVSGEMPEEFQDDSEILAKIKSYPHSEMPRKFVVAKEITERIVSSGGKVIIWTIFIQNAKDLRKYFAESGIHSELLIGEIDQANREAAIQTFNNPDDRSFQVMIANPFSVAESISLHKGCHNAIYFERDYNASNFLQSKDRIHRVGLSPSQETHYYYLVSDESIDEVINERLQMKVQRMEEIIDDDIPLFARIHDDDETDLIRALIEDYARRT
jgi:SNF2 family DNA or RNA helicase